MGVNKFTLTRTFKAPIKLVFKAFSTKSALIEWWGPGSAKIEVISLDFKPRGTFRYRVKGDMPYYGLFKYIEIDEPYTIAWLNSFTNEAGEVIKPPFEGFDLPKEILNKITLTEENGITTMILLSEPYNASQSETNAFNSIEKDMERGWGGSFDKLGNYLTQDYDKSK